MNTLLGDRVTVITEASEDEKLTELMKAHFLIMPSRSESFGLPVVEAMRAGTPVISSSGGALGEVVGVADVNRIYDDPEDADALAEIIVEMTSKGVEQALQPVQPRETHTSNIIPSTTSWPKACWHTVRRFVSSRRTEAKRGQGVACRRIEESTSLSNRSSCTSGFMSARRANLRARSTNAS